MKKLSIVLTLAMCMTFVSCSDNGKSDTTVVDETTTTASVKITTSEQDVETTTEEVTEEITTAEEIEFELEKISESTIEETVLVDENNIKITANSISYDSWSPELNLTFENNSDKDLTFNTTDFCSLNGYMFSLWMPSTEVTAGKKAKKSISIDTDEMAMFGLTEIADIEIGFVVKDADYEDYLISNHIQLPTSAYEKYVFDSESYRTAVQSPAVEQTFDYENTYFNVSEIYNNSDIICTSQALLHNEDDENILYLEFVNNSSEAVAVGMRDIYVDDLLLYDYNWTQEEISPNKTAIIDINMTSVINEAYGAAFDVDVINGIKMNVYVDDANYDTFIDEIEIDIPITDAVSNVNRDGTIVYDANDIIITYNSIVPDEYDHINDVHPLFLIQNNSGQEMNFDISSDSLSIDGYMIDEWCSDVTVLPNRMGIFDLDVDGDSLEENGITTIDQITNLEFTLEIENEDNDDVDEIVIKLDC